MRLTRKSLLFVLLLLPFVMNGQEVEKEDLVQFSGMIRNLQHRPLPYVNIVDLSTRKGTTADPRGLFSFIVYPGDTVMFSFMGYKPTIHIIPDSLLGQQYPADIFLVSDTFQLTEVRIYPWKTYEEFREAVVSLKLPDDDEQRAYRNIALIKTQIRMSDPAPNASINFREVMKQQSNQLYTAGQYPYYTIFDPLRWAEFFEALKNGDFKNTKTVDDPDEKKISVPYY